MSKLFFIRNQFFALLLLACLGIHFTGCEKTSPDNTGGNGGSGGSGGTGGGGGSTAPTITEPDTYFIDVYQTFNGLGSYWVQEFTVNTTTSFVLRGASTYKADFAVFAPAQLNSFKNNQGFSAFVVMDDQFGTQYVTLAPGTYYAGVRNQVSTANAARIELDKRITLPTSDKCTFNDTYFTAAKTVAANNGWVTQPFTVQQGYRYFIDGCNSSDIEYWVIPQSETSKFTSGQSFQFYQDYHGLSTAEPGSHSMKLPPGNYVYAFRNTGTKAQALTYVCERWKVN